MLPFSFRFEDAAVLQHGSGFQSQWRSFGNTVITQVRHGSYRIETLGPHIDIPSGGAFLMPPGCRHRVSSLSKKEVRTHAVHLHCRVYEMDGLFTVLNKPLIFSKQSAGRIALLHDEIMECIGGVVDVRNSARVNRILAEMVELSVEACPEISDAWDRPERERMLPLLKYIQQHLGDELTRDVLAQFMDVSIPHLHTLVVNAFGYAPMEIVRRERMQHARQLLHWTDMPIAEVAHICGFEDQYYFSRAFKQFEGVPPSRYRRAVQPDV